MTKTKESYKALQRRKAVWIPKCARGEISIRKCARKIGVSPYCVWDLKGRYIEKGRAVFVNGHKGLSYQKKKYTPKFKAKVVGLYKEHYDGHCFAAFQKDLLEPVFGICIPYNALRKILSEAGIKPPRSWSSKEKKAHHPRDERPREGELVQMDASKHDWFLNGQYATCHGAVDDATHTVTALYFCENECRLGYNEVLRLTWQNYGVPEAYYIDRHSSFVKNKRKSKSLLESIDYSKSESTHFVDLCAELTIEVILALSAQAKGRVERLWGVLQERLPPLFRFLGVDNCEKANEVVSWWLARLNAERVVAARERKKAWRSLPKGFDMDYKLSIKFPKRTDWQGRFLFHNCEFVLDAPLRAYKDFDLCLSEKFGVRAYMCGKWFNVSLADEFLQDEYGDRMPQVEKALVERYMLSDLREESA